MKLLFDQNISFRVVKKIKEYYPDAQQVRMLNLEGATDRQIWEYARKEGYTIVTFDADFMDIAHFKGFPPKIIWLRLKNPTTDNIADLLIGKYASIADFILNAENTEVGCLELS